MSPPAGNGGSGGEGSDEEAHVEDETAEALVEMEDTVAEEDSVGDEVSIDSTGEEEALST